jgi:hypothetical protein
MKWIECKPESMECSKKWISFTNFWLTFVLLFKLWMSGVWDIILLINLMIASLCLLLINNIFTFISIQIFAKY